MTPADWFCIAFIVLVALGVVRAEYKYTQRLEDIRNDIRNSRDYEDEEDEDDNSGVHLSSKLSGYTTTRKQIR